MVKFSYTAEKTDGEIYQGIAEARDRFELYQIIRQEGGRLLHLSDERALGFLSLKRWDILLTRVSQQQKIIFARNVGSMLSAGLSLARALSVMERETKNPRLGMMISQIASDVRRGSQLHAAMTKFSGVFPPQIIAMTRAGEESGDLATSLKLTADNLERAHSLKKKIRGAMFYPSIVLIAVVGIGALMMIFVVPTLTSVFAQTSSTLPTSTRIIIGISNALTRHTTLSLWALVIAAILLYTGFKSEKGKVLRSWILIRMPLIGGLTREVNAARTARSLSSLIASGVDVLTALDITHDVVQNVYFQAVIATAKKDVGQGLPLSAAFIKHEDLYPAFVGEMMAVGEETGQTADMLKNLAIFYEEEVDRKTKDMSTIIEPLLMIVIGAAVGFFALSMITPIYQVTQHVS